MKEGDLIAVWFDSEMVIIGVYSHSNEKYIVIKDPIRLIMKLFPRRIENIMPDLQIVPILQGASMIPSVKEISIPHGIYPYAIIEPDSQDAEYYRQVVSAIK